jgi:hypothetical protein
MRVHFSSPLVVSAFVGLSGILLVPDRSPAAATHQGDDSKTEATAKVEKVGPESQARKNGTGLESPPANPKMAATDALMRTLDQEISTNELPRSFFALLDYLTKRVGGASSRGLPFFVDARLFSKEVRMVLDGEIPPPVFKVQPLPPRMSVRSLLQMAFNEFDGGEATFLIRQGRVEIITKKEAATENLLKQTFAASFDRQPLEFVLDDLSEITGVSVVIDGRARDKTRTPITARFRNDVPLLEALHMVTESAGLTLVELPGGQGPTRALFVTTPEHARERRKK